MCKFRMYNGKIWYMTALWNNYHSRVVASLGDVRFGHFVEVVPDSFLHHEVSLFYFEISK